MKRTLLAALLAACFTPALAGDLLSAYRDAVANDAVYAAARAQLAAGREKTAQSRAGLLPTVTASASVFQNDADLKSLTATVSESFATRDLKLTAVQPLYRRQNWIGAAQGELQTAQAEANFEQAGQDLIVRVAEAYFAVLYAQETARVVEAQKTAVAKQLELAKKTFEVGTSTITDTHEAQARYDLILAQEIAAQNAIEVARQALQTVVGKDAGNLSALKSDATPAAPQPAGIAEWVAQAEQQNVQVRVQQINAELAAKSAESASAGHHPTLDLVASYGMSQNDLFKTSPGGSYDNKTLSVGVQLNVPLYTGGGTSAREREAASLREAAKSGVEAARRQAALAARQAYLGVVNGLAQVKALEAAVTSSRSALEATKVGYEVGVRINNDVLNAEQQYAAAQRDLYKAKLDTLLASLKLKSAAGSLSEADVAAVNALLGSAT